MYSGSCGSEVGLELLGGRVALVAADDVGDEALVASDVLARERPRIRATSGCVGEHGLDLAELDAEAADLDLVVDPAQVLEVAVRRGAGPGRRCGRAGARRPGTGRARSARRSARGARGSPRARRRRRRTSRPGRRSAPALPCGSSRYSRRSGIGTPITLPGAGLQIVQRDRPVGHVHRRLGDPVHVHQLRQLVAVALEPGPQALQLQRLAAEDHVPQSRRHGRPRLPRRPGSAAGTPTASG